MALMFDETSLPAREREKRRRVRKQVTFDPDVMKTIGRLAEVRHESFSGTLEHLLTFVLALVHLGMPLDRDGAISWLKQIKELKPLYERPIRFTDFDDSVRIKRGA
jgi:hypothetical protein